MEGLTQLASESLFSNNRRRQSFVATQSADYTISRAKKDFGRSCDQGTGLSGIVACISLAESLIRQIRAQPRDLAWRPNLLHRSPSALSELGLPAACRVVARISLEGVKPVSAYFAQEYDLAAFFYVREGVRPRRNSRSF
jgi:hypothetical protein